MTEKRESASRARTRQAILEAAIEVLGRNPAAPLGEVAVAAAVGRTTLHRYFPERSDLLAALGAEAASRLGGVVARARTPEGSGAVAFRRLCAEYFDLGELLSLLFRNPVLLDGLDWSEQGACDAGVTEVIERGHRDGTIDPELPVDWLRNFIWAQLYTGWSYQAETGRTRHEVLRLILRTVDGVIAVKRD